MVNINLTESVIRSYLFYVSVLVLKTFLMSILTGIQRSRKQAYVSTTDVKFVSKVLKEDTATVKFDDEDVERYRRAHLNDLENIPLFILCGFVYVLTKPAEVVAVNLFRIFTFFRILHTIIYAVYEMPQPTRMICFFIPFSISFYMSITGLTTFFYP